MSIEQLTLATADKSPCAKRKVGAIIVNEAGAIIGTGYNHIEGLLGEHCCEDEKGDTLPEVVHAEIMALRSLREFPHAIYVTHKPCANCAKAIELADIKETIIVENFMKFDAGKIRYDLVPTSAFEGLAKVLTYGAKKYKPNNWRNAEDLDRYVAALYRHIEAWRKGEKVDEESGLKHLEHALTNISFLLELDPDDSEPPHNSVT